ncbi:MAG: glycine cleavage system protein GcvH [Gemmataceae bacterium]|jgi:glycine cleavage system H protein|nr:glycine cleavage system protein GcvH [Gemmataceae bacterium]
MDPKTLRYTKTHEWVAVDGDVATVGVSRFAADLLNDITFVGLPATGKAVSAGKDCGAIETVKSANDLYSPVDGEISAANHEVATNPGLIQEDPYGQGWLFKVKMSPGASLGHLLDAAAYEEHCANEAH